MTDDGQDLQPPCPRCGKPPALCVCADIESIRNRVGILILQHPQEQDKEIGTAKLTTLHFENAVFKIGLSWPSLAKALGREVDPGRWAALYLGSLRAQDFPPGLDLAVFDKKGMALPDQERALKGVNGIILLDGTWSQAKTLWWRNPWLLKGRRIALRPKRPSLYGRVRREPRREALSTLEAAAMVLSRLENRADIEPVLLGTFGRLLDQYRAFKAPARSSK